MKFSGLLTFIVCVYSQHLFAQGYNLPFNSSFDSKTERELWREYRLGNKHINNWDFSNAITYSKPYSLFHDYPIGNHKADTVSDFIVSPPLDIKKGAVIYFELIIFSANNQTEYSDKFSVYLGKKNRNPKMGEFTEFINLNKYASNSSRWNEVKLIIPPQTDSCFIALHYQSTNNIFTVNVDNFIVNDLELEDNIKPNSIVEFSNPFDQRKSFKVKVDGNTLILNLYDLNGRCLISQSIDNGKNKLNKRLEPGVYDVKITDLTGEIKQHQKLIISN